jgi:hypothetical protein
MRRKMDLFSYYGGGNAQPFLIVPYAIPERCTATYYPKPMPCPN